MSNVKISESSIQIIINDIIKTSAPYCLMPNLVIPFYPNKIEVCPARTLLSYVEATVRLRSEDNTDRLFLTTKKPFRNASSSTISRWIKEIMRDSGINTDI
ncbi:hypothetical protein O3G_MSEX015112 [Manduca sexta]|uniref:Uncharacterized protein n=1 Tax=Manduca sexta TaxID=7130 RepID=A0A921ZXP7_MANSE|nr:hypothetical protein O3G_MSEX015112 [Manduca sexta]